MDDNNDKTQLDACKKLYEKEHAMVTQLQIELEHARTELASAHMKIDNMETCGGCEL